MMVLLPLLLLFVRQRKVKLRRQGVRGRERCETGSGGSRDGRRAVGNGHGVADGGQRFFEIEVALDVAPMGMARVQLLAKPNGGGKFMKKDKNSLINAFSFSL